MSGKESTSASLWADKPEPKEDVLQGVVLASKAPPDSEPSRAASEQREMFRENDLTDLATYLVR